MWVMQLRHEESERTKQVLVPHAMDRRGDEAQRRWDSEMKQPPGHMEDMRRKQGGNNSDDRSSEEEHNNESTRQQARENSLIALQLDRTGMHSGGENIESEYQDGSRGEKDLKNTAQPLKENTQYSLSVRDKIRCY